MTRRTSAGRPAPKARAIPFEHQPELRALMILPTLPAGHMTFPVSDDAFYPHLRRGEFAVVDLADHQPAEGELFLIAYGSPNTECGFIYRICQMRGRMEFQRPDGCMVLRPEKGAVPAVCWTACHWIPPGTREGYAAALRTGCVGTSEGPFTTEHATEKLVGRVVGVFVPASRVSD